MNKKIIKRIISIFIAISITGIVFFYLNKIKLFETQKISPLKLQQVGKEKVISPQNGGYGRVEVIEIKGRIFMALNHRETKTFKLIELNENLSYKSSAIDIFSDSPQDSIDIRLSSDGENLWYAFESILSKNQGSPNCNYHFLNIAKYNISENKPEIINSKTHIATGCPTTIKDYENPSSDMPKNPEAVDDPTPIFYNGKYVILTRALSGTVQHIRTFDNNFNMLENFTLDLKSAIGDRTLSQNALVVIEDQIYLIGGLRNGAPVDPNTSSDIYAISLSNDLHSVKGNPIPLVKGPDRYYMKTTSAIYDNGKLYINYVKAGAGQLQHLGVFDVKNNFSSLAQIQIQEKSVNINHSSLEVFKNKVFFFYQGEDENKIPIVLGKVFEWQ